MEHGGKRAGAGRKGKAEEQKLIENLTPMSSIALESLQKGLEKKEQWAVKLFFEYFYGTTFNSSFFYRFYIYS